MLGLSSTLSTASIHEQRYALDFDGADDYLVFGSATHNHLDFGTGDFSISLWFKMNVYESGNQYILSKFDGSSNRVDIFLANSNSLKFTAVGGNTTLIGANDLSGSPISDLGSVWVHALVSVDRAGDEAIAAMYVNGSTSTYGGTEDMSETDASINLNNTAKWTVGALSTTSQGFIDGRVSDVALFNVALNSDAAVAIYNSGKPFDLNYNRGNYSNSSALISYWRMGNGLFDDAQNGAVHDAHNPGFGADVVTNGTFDSNASSWTADSGCNLAWQSDGTLLVTDTVDSSPKVFAIQQSGILTANTTYKFSFRFKPNAAGEFRVRLGGSAETFTTTSFTANEWNNIVGYGVADGTPLQIGANAGTPGMDSFFIDDISVVPLNGFPGITSKDINGDGAVFSTDTPDD